MNKIRSEKIPYFIDIKEAPKFMQMEGLETILLTGLHGEKMMMVFNTTLPGHSVPTHSQKHEQVSMVYRGEAKLRIGDEERLVKTGDLFCIPSNTPHSDTCIGNEPFVMLDIFYPKRKDFLKEKGKLIPHGKH